MRHVNKKNKILVSKTVGTCAHRQNRRKTMRAISSPRSSKERKGAHFKQQKNKTKKCNTQSADQRARTRTNVGLNSTAAARHTICALHTQRPLDCGLKVARRANNINLKSACARLFEMNVAALLCHPRLHRNTSHTADNDDDDEKQQKSCGFALACR